MEQVTAISVSDTKQIKSTPSIQKISSSTDKDSMDSSSKHPSTTDGGGPDIRGSRKTLTAIPIDMAAATFLDVAVLRCLFIAHWQEEGVYWALHYMYNRLEPP